MGDDSTKPLDISLYSTIRIPIHQPVAWNLMSGFNVTGAPPLVCFTVRCSKLPFVLGRGNCTEESLDFKVAMLSLGLEGGGGCPKAGWGYTWRGVGKHRNYWETPSELDVWLFLMC